MIRETADAPLRQRNSFHVEEQAERLIEFDREEDLDLIFGKGRPERWYVLGGGNNILFTRRFEGTLIKPAATGITVIGEDADTVTLRAEAATDWDRMVAWCVERGLWGAENLSLIPGTVGASPVQNIGAYGAEAAGIIYRVHLYDTLRREHVTLEKADCRFAYRDSIFKHEMRGRTVITAVELRLGKHPSPNLAYGDLKAQVGAAPQSQTYVMPSAPYAAANCPTPTLLAMPAASSRIPLSTTPRQSVCGRKTPHVPYIRFRRTACASWPPDGLSTVQV